MESLDIVQSGIVAYRRQFGRFDLSTMDSKRLVLLDLVDANVSSGGNEYPLVLPPTSVLPWSDEPTHLCWWLRKSPPFPIVHSIVDRINCHYRLALPTTSVFETARMVGAGGVFLVLTHNLHDSWDI